METRITPTTVTWTGLGPDNLWTDSANWVGGVVPTNGFDIVFPDGAKRTSNYNDTKPEYVYNSITIGSPLYDLSGNSLGITTGITTTGIPQSPAVMAKIELHVILSGTDISFQLPSPGVEFTKSAVISGAGNLHFTGASQGFVQIDSNCTMTGTIDFANNASYQIAVTGSISSATSLTLQAGDTLEGGAVASPYLIPNPPPPPTLCPVISTGGKISPALNTLPSVYAVPYTVFASNITLDNNSTYVEQIGTDDPAAIYCFNDVLFLPAGGTVALNNATLTLNLGKNYQAQNLTLITGATSIVGTFNGLPEGAQLTIAGVLFQITYVGGKLGHDVQLNAVQYPTTTTLSASPTVTSFGSQVGLQARVTSTTGTPYGYLEFVDGTTVLGRALLNPGGTAAMLFSTLPAGANSITAVFEGSLSYLTSTSAPLGVTISAVPTTTTIAVNPSPSVYGQYDTLMATVHSGGGIPTGDVTFKSGSASLGKATLDSTGVAVFVSNVFLGGVNIVVASYGGDGNFLASSGSITEQVSPASVNVGLATSSTPAVYGDPTTFTAVVQPVSAGPLSPTGIIVFKDEYNNMLGQANIDASGFAAFTTPALYAGSHQITATYNGDTNYATAASLPIPQVITPQPSSVSISSSANPSVYGQPLTYTVRALATVGGVVYPTGSVSLMDGGTAIGTANVDSQGTATFSVSAPSFGSHSLTATYTGDTNFLSGASSVFTQTVGQANTAAVITSSINPSVYGQTTTLTATVTVLAPAAGLPTGTVTFMEGAIKLGASSLSGGVASLPFSNLFTGSQLLTAIYSGDTYFKTSTSAAVGDVVRQASSTVSLVALPSATVFGQSTTLTATIAAVAPGGGVPTGLVTFENGTNLLGTVTISGGKAVLSTSAFNLGSNAITAIYQGDTNFKTSTSAITPVNVNQATAITVVKSPGATVVGQLVTFNLTEVALAPGVGMPTGTVRLYDGSTLLGTATLDATGVANLTSPGLSLGTHTITASYFGDTNFLPNTSSSITQTVGQAASSLMLTSAFDGSSFGQGATFSVTLSAAAPGAGTPTGTIILKTGQTILGTVTISRQSGGTGSFYVSSLPVGANKLVATYSGDASFTGTTSSTITQHVVRDQSIVTLTATPSPAPFGQAVTLKATIAPQSPGMGTPSGTVTFSEGTKTLGTANVSTSSGASVATFYATGLALGSHNLIVSYNGDGNFVNSAVAGSVTVNPAPTSLSLTLPQPASTFSQNIPLTAVVQTAPSGGTIPTGSVTFIDGGVVLGTVGLSNGSASLTPTGANAGNHIYTAVYNPSPAFLTSSGGATEQVVPEGTTLAIRSTASTAIYGQQVTYVAVATASFPGSATPNGVITFWDNSSVIGQTGLTNGQAQITVPVTYTGATHGIHATFSPANGNYGSSSSGVIAETVIKSNTMVQFYHLVTSTKVGFPVVVVPAAPGAGIPTGTVSFLLNGKVVAKLTLVNGGAEYLAVKKGILNKAYSVIYSGDANFNPSASKPLLITQAVLNGGPNPIMVMYKKR